MPRTTTAAAPADDTWGRSTVRTACPLDCPDSCTLDVTVERGRVVNIDGGHANPVDTGVHLRQGTALRRAPLRRGSPALPGDSQGPEGPGHVRRGSRGTRPWSTSPAGCSRSATASAPRRSCPSATAGRTVCSPRTPTDATLFRGFGTSRLARTVCAAPTGAANQALYGKMPGVTYEDYVHARLIVLWGVNPSASGIHLIPYIKDARKHGAQLVVVDPRATALARQADLHIAPRPGTDLPLALALHRALFESGAADEAFLQQHAHGAAGASRTSRMPGPSNAPPTSAGVARGRPRPLRGPVRGRPLPRSSAAAGGSSAIATAAAPPPPSWRCRRWRASSASAAAAISMSNSASVRHQGGGLDGRDPRAAHPAGQHEPPRARPARVHAIRRSRCCSSTTATRWRRCRIRTGCWKACKREDLFTVVFEQVFTDTARYADVILPATTFLENYDIAKGYGPISLQLVKPVIEPCGEARPNAEVFSALAARLGLGDAEEEVDTLLRVTSRLPPDVAASLLHEGAATPPYDGAPVQFVDVFPLTPDHQDRSVSGGAGQERAGRTLRLSVRSGDRSVPAGADLAGQREDDLVDARRAARARRRSCRCTRPTRRRAAWPPTTRYACSTTLGEVHCPVALNPDLRPGHGRAAERAVAEEHVTTARRPTPWSPTR